MFLYNIKTNLPTDIPMDISSDESRKRKREEAPQETNKRVKIDPFLSILPPLFHQSNPLLYAKFDAQFRLIKKQLAARQMPDEAHKEVALKFGSLFGKRMNEKDKLAEFAAFSALLNAGLLLFHKLLEIDSFIWVLNHSLLTKIAALQAQDSTYQGSERAQSLPLFSYHYTVEWFAQLLYLNDGINPGAGELTEYLLKQIGHPSTIQEDHLHHLCHVTSHLAMNERFAEDCATPLEVHPSMTSYLNSILFRHPDAPLTHQQTIQALIICLLSRVRQFRGPQCYADATQISRTQNNPYQMFVHLKEIFSKGFFFIHNTKFPASPLLELTIYPHHPVLNPDVTGFFQKLTLVQSIAQAAGHPLLDPQREVPLLTILPDPSAQKLLIHQLSQIATLPLFIYCMMESVNIDSIGINKRFLQQLVKFIQLNPTYQPDSIMRKAAKPLIDLTLRGRFFFFDLPIQQIIPNGDHLRVLSGPYQGNYPFSVKQESLFNGLRDVRILLYHDRNQMWPCTSIPTFINALTDAAKKIPCPSGCKDVLLKHIQSSKTTAWASGLMESLGELPKPLVTVLKPLQHFYFSAAGANPFESISPWIQQHQIGDITMESNMVARWHDVVSLIKRQTPLPKCVLLSTDDHYFTAFPNLWPDNLKATVKKAEYVARVFLRKPVSEQTIDQFFDCLDKSQAAKWLKYIKVTDGRFTYQNAIDIALENSIPLSEIRRTVYQRIIRQQASPSQLNQILEHVTHRTFEQQGPLIQELNQHIQQSPMSPFMLSRTIGKILAKFQFPYFPISHIESVVRDVLELPERIYLGDSNHIKRSGATIWHTLDYDLVNLQWQLVIPEEEESELDICTKNFTVYTESI